MQPQRPTGRPSAKTKKARKSHRRRKNATFGQRLYDEGKRQQRRRERIARTDTPPECTFTPLLSTALKKTRTGRRSAKTAVEDTLYSMVDAISQLGADQKSRSLLEDAYHKRIQQRIQQRIEDIQKSTRRNQNTFDELWKDGQKRLRRRKKMDGEKVPRNCTFKPTLNHRTRANLGESRSEYARVAAEKKGAERFELLYGKAGQEREKARKYNLERRQKRLEQEKRQREFIEKELAALLPAVPEGGNDVRLPVIPKYDKERQKKRRELIAILKDKDNFTFAPNIRKSGRKATSDEGENAESKSVVQRLLKEGKKRQERLEKWGKQNPGGGMMDDDGRHETATDRLYKEGQDALKKREKLHKKAVSQRPTFQPDLSPTKNWYKKNGDSYRLRQTSYTDKKMGRIRKKAEVAEKNAKRRQIRQKYKRESQVKRQSQNEVTQRKEEIEKVETNEDAADAVENKHAVENKDPAETKDAAKNKGLCTAFALYDYEAEEDDEMTLVAGAEIAVTEKDDSSEGWWTGRLATGKAEGAFPMNYVYCVLAFKGIEYMLMPETQEVFSTDANDDEENNALMGKWDSEEKVLIKPDGVKEEWKSATLL
eukprot:g874.t1